ncbi:MAG: ankyrin repeat domain-containing protein, partial [Synergistaceae bacterium]|nr:ankyrin repeat domain-containing protein [Synergistaceae bacterium]
MKRLRFTFLSLVILILGIPCFLAHAATDVLQKKDFFELCKNGTPREIDAAVKSGADVNASDNDGDTVLIYAARYNKNADVILSLTGAGADVNAKSKNGWTALMYAARYNENADV